jgi:hypothetical protein
MRNQLRFCISIGVFAILLSALDVYAGDRRDRISDAGGYDVRAERILEGIVAGKGHVIGGLMYFPLKTADTVVEVQVCPQEFVERSTFTFKPGDLVVVVGVRVVFDDGSVVLARQISGMKGTLILRDEQGVLYGTAIRSERIR